MSEGDWCVRRTSCAPRFASSSATDAPIPDVPPVIIITLLCICRSEVFDAPAEYHFNSAITAIPRKTLRIVQASGSAGSQEIFPQRASLAIYIGIVVCTCA